MPVNTKLSGDTVCENVTFPLMLKLICGREGSFVFTLALWPNCPGGTVACHSILTLVDSPGCKSVFSTSNVVQRQVESPLISFNGDCPSLRMVKVCDL